jgi:stage V sporulation protein R
MGIAGESDLLSNGVSKELAELIPDVLKACDEHGLDPYPLCIEEFNADEIVEIAAFGGFPVRYPHFSFGQQYESLHHQYHSGLGKIYEMVVNTDPTYMYLQRNNPVVDNLTVVAHATAHSDFFKNNIMFKHTNRNMMNVMANHGQKIRKYMDMFGRKKVKDFLNASVAVSDLTDPSLCYRESVLKKPKNFNYEDKKPKDHVARIKSDHEYMDKFLNPDSYIERQRRERDEQEKLEAAKYPVKPERDIMLFLLNHAPLTPWQQNILSMVRDEALYFRPQGMTKVMNEGWASYWDSYIMASCNFAGDDGIFDYAKHHAGVLGGKYNMSNPYKLGNTLFRDIEDRWNKGKFGKEWDNCEDYEERRTWDKKLGLGREKMFEIRSHYNDVTFLNEFFTKDFCYENKFFEYELDKDTNKYVVVSKDYKRIKRKVIDSHLNMGMPIILLDNIKYNGNEMMLKHDFEGRPLDLKYATGTMAYIHEIYKSPINIITYDVMEEGYGSGKEVIEVEVRYRFDNGEMKRYEGSKV